MKAYCFPFAITTFTPSNMHAKPHVLKKGKWREEKEL